jgi:hypothetical protein
MPDEKNRRSNSMAKTDEKIDTEKMYVRRVRWTSNTGESRDEYIRSDKLPSGWATKWSSAQWLYVREMLCASDSHAVYVGKREMFTPCVICGEHTPGYIHQPPNTGYLPLFPRPIHDKCARGEVE